MAIPIVGIVGGGKFGMALAKLLAPNCDVLLYSRREELIQALENNMPYNDISLPENVNGTLDLEELAHTCQILFPVISSNYFESVIKRIAPFLTPEHILIHGTKGFGSIDEAYFTDPHHPPLSFSNIRTMSDIILEHTDVIRVGALCGPNLAIEILHELPTATVIASEFDEVIQLGDELLSGANFFVFGSYDVRGAELAGALKNVIALASGMLGGSNLGKNAEAMLITRGLHEMIKIGETMGATYKAFLGTAGLGDLIATATSNKSRNYTFGWRIAQGEKSEDILASMKEVVEGLKSLKIAYEVIQQSKLWAPIISTIYDVIYNKKDIKESIHRLMKYPTTADVDFI